VALEIANYNDEDRKTDSRTAYDARHEPRANFMMENIFAKPPAYGIISNWLGPEMVQRLLDFAQTQHDSFFPSGVGYDENVRVDANIRRSSRITKLGDLRNELRSRVKAAPPAMFKRLGTDAFEPSRLEWKWLRTATAPSSPNIAIRGRRSEARCWPDHRRTTRWFLSVLVSSRSPAGELSHGPVRFAINCWVYP